MKCVESCKTGCIDKSKSIKSINTTLPLVITETREKYIENCYALCN